MQTWSRFQLVQKRVEIQRKTQRAGGQAKEQSELPLVCRKTGEVE